MDLTRACVVRSAAGRDKGRLFVVIDCDESYVYLCDGRSRSLDNLKRKKIKHVKFHSVNDTRLGRKLREGEKVTNAEIRRTLKAIEDGNDEKQREE